MKLVTYTFKLLLGQVNEVKFVFCGAFLFFWLLVLWSFRLWWLAVELACQFSFHYSMCVYVWGLVFPWYVFFIFNFLIFFFFRFVSLVFVLWADGSLLRLGSAITCRCKTHSKTDEVQVANKNVSYLWYPLYWESLTCAWKTNECV